jgi:hypothetical protein
MDQNGLQKRNLSAGRWWPHKYHVSLWSNILMVLLLKIPRRKDTEVEHACSIYWNFESCLLGFVHYRFVVEEELPVLCVWATNGAFCPGCKGLGKFMMQLTEQIACKVMWSVLLIILTIYYSYLLNIFLDMNCYCTFLFFLLLAFFSSITVLIKKDNPKYLYKHAEPNGSCDANSSES